MKKIKARYLLDDIKNLSEKIKGMDKKRIKMTEFSRSELYNHLKDKPLEYVEKYAKNYLSVLVKKDMSKCTFEEFVRESINYLKERQEWREEQMKKFYEGFDNNPDVHTVHIGNIEVKEIER